MSEQQTTGTPASQGRMSPKKRFLVVSLSMLAGAATAAAVGTIFALAPLCG